MKTRFALAVLLVVVLSAAAASQSLAGSAASRIRPTPGAPDPRAMVLTPADLGGARVVGQGYFQNEEFPSVISYAREFEGGRLGAVRLSLVDSEAAIGISAASTRRYLARVRTFAKSNQGRTVLAEAFEEPGSVMVIRVLPLGAGPGSFDLSITVREPDSRLEAHLAMFRVERVLITTMVFGAPGRRVPLATMTRLSRAMIPRIGAQLVPRIASPPVVSGAPIVGQPLTASPGTWTGTPTRIEYQWQRCDPSGAACTDIAGAVAQTYVVAESDVGALLRVSVTASNAFGSATAVSAPTTQVSGAPLERRR